MVIPKSEFFGHIRDLGLSSVDEYQEWCRKHGFTFHRKKNWREMREELRVAEKERERAAVLEHIGDLGLSSEDEYREWCRRYGFEENLDKTYKQRCKERAFAEKAKGNGRAGAGRNGRAGAGRNRVRTLHEVVRR